LVFDPDDREGFATTVLRMWNEPDLRRVLIERGREQVRPLSWDRTARTFRAHYRQVGGRALTAEDHALISGTPYL
jgi:hypothetical protein